MTELDGLVDVAVWKVAYSAFFNTQLDWVLRRAGIEHVAICGIVTNGGVASTARDAHMRDYHVTVLADGCAAPTPALHDAALADLRSVADLRACGTSSRESSDERTGRAARAGTVAARAHHRRRRLRLTAAIRLARSGVECVVIERDAVPAGSSALSSGFIPAAGTRVQRAAGVADSVDDFAADILAKTGGAAAAHLVQAYARAAPAAIDALEWAGLRFELLDGFLYPGHRARRMHTLRQRSGQALMAALGQAAADSGALVLTRTLARELRHDGQGRITAVICERPDGTRESIGCDALILACNGFGGNAAMVREHLPAMADAVYGGHAGNDGSAVRWGRELGAGLADMGAYQGHGSWATPQGALVSWAVIMDGGVQSIAWACAFTTRPGLFGSGGARAGAAGRRGLERVRRPGAGAGAGLSRFPGGARGGARPTTCRRWPR